MKKRLFLLLSGSVFLLGANPIEAFAKENPVLGCAGVELVLNLNGTEEEYIQAANDAVGALWGYTNLGMCNVESGNLNVRKEPSAEGKLVGKMRRNDACEILDIKDGWYHIRSGEVEGYVKAEYLLAGLDAKQRADSVITTVAIAKVDGLNVRREASKDSPVVTQVAKGETMDYLETAGDWVKIEIDGEPAYVATEYVSVEESLNTAITMTELLYGQGVSDLRVDMVEYAKQFIGNPYVWGGTSLTKGADCSGFVLSIYKKFGIKLSHSSRAQAKEGKKIAYKDILPGDLVFYGSPTISHVAMYIGGGKVIHAASPKQGIIISKYNYHTPVKYVRIIKD